MWVAITLASLAVIIIAVLCVPFDMVLHLNVGAKPRFQTKLSWFFGLVTKEIGKEKKRKVTEGKRKTRKKREIFRDIFKIMRTRGLVKRFKTLIADALRQLKVKDVTADFRVGLGDPADTGLLFAFIGPATVLLNRSFPGHIRVQPSFKDRAVFETYSHGTVRLRPIQLAMPVFRFIFSPATARTIKKLISSKWTGKK